MSLSFREDTSGSRGNFYYREQTVKLYIVEASAKRKYSVGNRNEEVQHGIIEKSV